jgi:regulatory protein
VRSRQPSAPLDQEPLYNYALRLLGHQMRTVAEIKRRLRPKVEAGPLGEAKIEAVVTRLKENRYLDDAGFALDYAKLRQENANLGRRRVQQDLLRKGVHAEVIAESLDTAYAGVGEEELARRHLERKRIPKPSSEKEAARVARLLLRAGISTPVIMRILKKWDVDDDALAALESADPGDTNGER